tara:strand:- start:15 stop:131 length:117 start_codon:yes stop_codon:yes gene_type:complete
MKESTPDLYAGAEKPPIYVELFSFSSITESVVDPILSD